MAYYDWLNEDSLNFLRKDYLLKNQTVSERISLIGKTSENLLDLEGFSKKIIEGSAKGWNSFSTPVWTNFGVDRGLPISCFGSYIEDTMESILSTHSEIGMMTKYGGGTSAYFGNVRPRGSSIKDNGYSSGSVHFMEMYEHLLNVVSQGNVRRGAMAAYLPLDHPDIMEFLQIREIGDAIQNLSIGVTVDDKWLQEMKAGDREKRKIWARVIQKRVETGYPYIIFSDNANNQRPEIYKKLGLKIHASNLCMTGDQRIVTNRGLLTAEELYEQGGNLTLFNNKEQVEAKPMQLIERNADVYKVTLENGMSHTITEYHKVLTSKRSNDREEITKIKQCSELNIGDRIAIQTNKGLFGNKDYKDEAFLLGMYQSDGTQHKDKIMLDLWENDFDLVDEIQDKFNNIHYKYKCDSYEIPDINGNKFSRKCPPAKFYDCSIPNGSSVAKKRLSSKTLHKALNFQKGYIPQWIWESNEATQWEYVRGLLYADGTVCKSESTGNPIQIAYADINKDFLVELQMLFANLGLQTSIRILRKAGKQLLPDGRGGSKLYDTKDCWRLIIGNKNDALQIEEYTKFLSRKGVFVEKKLYRDNTKKYHKISSIEYVGKEDVYCCTVDSDDHLFIANGFVTHNCSEIFLPSNDIYSFVCCLSSLNLEKYDEWKDTDFVETMVMFLDSVMTEFITKTENNPLMIRAHNFAKDHRALGLGVLGWHSLLQKRNIAFESMEAKLLNAEIFKNIREQADRATEKLAKMYGEPKLLKGTGRRNTTTIAIAPTVSSSFILGQTSPSIEPLQSNYFIKDLAKGKYTYINPYLKTLLQEKNQDKVDVWNSILMSGGSVQHLDFLSQHEKDVFKTFEEISQKEIIIQASQRQKYIDQGQSLNLMIPAKTSTKDINSLLLFAWENNIKSLYYHRSTNPSQELARNIISGNNKETKVNIMECKSCEG